MCFNRSILFCVFYLYFFIQFLQPLGTLEYMCYRITYVEVMEKSLWSSGGTDLKGIMEY